MSVPAPAPARDDARGPGARPELQAGWQPRRPRSTLVEHADGTVDNLEWVDLPRGHPPLDLARLERLYFAWVPRLTVGLVTPRHVGPGLVIGIEPLHLPIAIALGPASEREGERSRPILGGMLARAGGSFGFEQRVRPEGTRLVVAVRHLDPRMPRWLYRRLQARLHARSTLGFLRELAAGAGS